MAIKCAAILLLTAMRAGAALAQGGVLPWGVSSDQAAWETFSQIVAPSGNPSVHQVEFETWASDADIYQTTPPLWPAPGSAKRLQASGLAGARHHGPRGLGVSADCVAPLAPKTGNFPTAGCIAEEVRRNWASFQYIVANNLYSTNGLKAAYASGLKVRLPADSVEFKGDWVRFDDLITWLQTTIGVTLSPDQVRQAYYTSTAGGFDYALVAMHFATKQVNQWVWADFEHQLNPGRCDDIGCIDSFGAVQSGVPAKPTPNQNYGACDKNPTWLMLMVNAGIDPVWGNYCLKGSQIDFVTLSGSPNLLGNSVIERITAAVPVKQSSCITCHAYAAFNADGKPGLLPYIAANHPVGKVDPNVLVGYRQNDFIWGIFLLPN